MAAKKKKSRTKAERIAGKLRELSVPIDSLTPDPENARSHNTRNLEDQRNSLTQFGQMKPIVVRKETGTIVAGNATWRAAKDLGWTEIAANVQPMTDAVARAYAVADNRTAETSEWNDQMLADTLQRIQTDAPELLPATGFSESELGEIFDEEEPEPKDADTRPPPKMAWVLVGIPVAQYGEIAALLEEVGQNPAVQWESTTSDYEGASDDAQKHEDR